MASITLDTGDAFADGATVGAYPVSAWSGLRPSGPPIVAATASATITNKQAAFTGLTAGVSYYLSNAAGSRYVLFTVPTTSLSTTSVAALATGTQAALDTKPTAALSTDGTLAANSDANVPSQKAVKTYADAGDLSGMGSFWNSPFLANGSGGAVTADRVYYSRVLVLASCTITGITYYVSSGATGNSRVALYNAAGTRVANRTTDFTVAGLDVVAFDAPYAAAKGIYYVACVFSGTPSIYIHLPAAPSGFAAGPGSTATATSITAPTTISSTRVPVMTTY